MVDYEWGRVPRGPEEPEYVEEEKSGIIFKATKDITKGKPVTSTYGNKSNFQLLTQFGFTNTNNPIRQQVFLRHVEVIPHDPLAEKKKEFFGEKEYF